LLLPPALAAEMDPAGTQQHVLYLEFAEYLPFVNTWLVKGDIGTQGSTMSRQLLRTCPRRRRYSDTSGAAESQLSTHLDGVDCTALLASLDALPIHAERFYHATLPQSVELGKSASARNEAPAPVTETSWVSAMDLWHAYFAEFILAPPESLYSQYCTAMAKGVVHLVDPAELAQRGLPLAPRDALHGAAADVLAHRTKDKKTGNPLPRRVRFHALSHPNRQGMTPTSAVTDAAEDFDAAVQWTCAFLAFKCCAADEPIRDAALSCFAAPPKTLAQGNSGLPWIRRMWEADEITMQLRASIKAMRAAASASDSISDETETASVKERLPFHDLGVVEMAMNAMYRGGALDSAAGAAKLIDQHAASGASESLLRVCGDVTAAEITMNAAEARRPYRTLRLTVGVLYALLRVPLLVMAVAVVVSLLVVRIL
jgi:hypothetical protein